MSRGLQPAVAIVALVTTGGAAWSQTERAGGDTALGQASATYRNGDREGAVATVALWTQSEVEAETQRLLDAVEAAGRTEGASPEEVKRGQATLVAAAGLLSDAALHALRQGERRRSRWHLHEGARLNRAVHSSRDQVAFARHFYLVSGLILQGMGDLAGAYERLSEGRRRLGDDTELLLASGIVSETVASLRSYEESPEGPRRPFGARASQRFTIEGQDDAGGPLPATNAADAQALYSRALQRDPGLLEARLRLGRVLLLRDRPREALPELERVARESRSAGQIYMARLLEGRVRERLGDFAGAVAAFAAAVEQAPRAQSALIALGRVLEQTGATRRAQETFDRVLQRTEDTVSDPWLDYIRGQPDRIDTLMGELRELVP